MKERPILESWKEISAYLERSVKTCQRWEFELDLPIHRLDGTPNASVFAYPDELDHWVTDKLHPPHLEDAKSVFVLRLKKVRIAAAAGIFACIVVAAGLIGPILLRKPVVFPSSPLVSLAVLPFENVVEDKSLEPWGAALAELF